MCSLEFANTLESVQVYYERFLQACCARLVLLGGALTEFFRCDQADLVTGPNLANTTSYAEHIVHARGKRTQFTSLSEDATKIREFGPQLWKLLLAVAKQNNHTILGHQDLMAALRRELDSEDDAASELALRAIPRAKKRVEALIVWNFDVPAAVKKNPINWATTQIQKFFIKA